MLTGLRRQADLRAWREQLQEEEGEFWEEQGDLLLSFLATKGEGGSVAVG